MKFLTTTCFFLFLSCLSFAQHDFFNEQYFNEFEKRYKTDPVECFKQETDHNFTAVYGDGTLGRKEGLIQFYSDFSIGSRNITELKTYQFGSTGIATGIINRVYVFKKDTSIRDWKHRFTYTFSWQKTRWVLVAVQYTDLPNNNLEYEEIVLKKMLDAEATAFSTADKGTILKLWKDDPKRMFMGNNADGAFYNLNYEGFKNYIVNNLAPTGFSTVKTNHHFNFKGNIVIVDYDQIMTTATGQKLYQHNVNAFERIGSEWKLILASNHGYTPTNKEKNAAQGAKNTNSAGR
jgi:hypothetical protein